MLAQFGRVRLRNAYRSTIPSYIKTKFACTATHGASLSTVVQACPHRALWADTAAISRQSKATPGQHLRSVGLSLASGRREFRDTASRRGWRLPISPVPLHGTQRHGTVPKLDLNPHGNHRHPLRPALASMQHTTRMGRLSLGAACPVTSA